MFFRRKKTKGHTYLQIVENRREEGKVKQTVVATLGRLDALDSSGQLEGLLRSGAKFAESVLVLGDLRPRNVWLNAGQVYMVDFATAHFGNPSFDLAFYSADLCLKAMLNSPQKAAYLEAINVFWSSYFRIAEYPRRQTELDAVREIRDYINQIQEAQERFAVARENVARSREDLRLAQEKFRVGAGTILDTITAESDLTSTKAAEVEAVVDYLISRARLYRATGRDFTEF